MENKFKILLGYETMKKIIEREFEGIRKETLTRFNEVFKQYHLGELKNKSKEYIEFLENEYFPHHLKILNKELVLKKKN